ncbi:MAG: aldehyde:ferredoxin oxidoreductase, partial [Chloroflexota bacterium]|nr:aldehyde:ferredoxin oxidoreductase [Chloroflexota bacterium]
MGFGSNGAILRIDLTAGTTAVETFDEAFYRRYPGGKALAAYHLLREMPVGADPLGPDNVLVLATGLLTSAPVSTATRFNAIARSPLTGGFGESEAGGYWGPELKMAGFDAIVLTGRSPRPAWIWVRDGEAEIRDASALWGQDPPTVQTAIKEAVGEKNARVLQIGRAGENLVPYAMLMNELRHYNGQVTGHTLMTVGVVASAAIGQWTTAALIVFFMRFADYLEQLTT